MNAQTPAGSLRWAVRSSFLRYVTVIAGGDCTLAGGAEVDAEGIFSFPLRAVSAQEDSWLLCFSGSVHFQAHHGLLDVSIIEPECIVGAGSGGLAARTDPSSPELAGIVAAAPAVARQVGGELVWEQVATELLEPAVALFGNVYPAGTSMAPLDLRATIDS